MKQDEHAGTRQGRTPRLWACLALATCLDFATIGDPGALAASACDEPSASDRITGTTPTGEFRLASGQNLGLVDIRLGEGAQDARLATWLKSLVGQTVAIAAGDPNRWDVRSGRVALVADEGESGGRGIDVAELLVAEGFALVDAGERDSLCRPALLALETLARRNRVGIWAGETGLMIPAQETARLAERIGRFTIVEGRVLGIGERPQRSYLNFGRFGTGAFAVTIPKRSWTALRARGIQADRLKGRRVRVRGLVEMWRAPMMEIVAPDMLEILDSGRDEPY
jgi:hypothetical protein